MQIKKYILYCSNCDPSVWIEANNNGVDEIEITLDLQTDEYIFKTTYPFCGKQIINKRRASNF